MLVVLRGCHRENGGGPLGWGPENHLNHPAPFLGSSRFLFRGLVEGVWFFLMGVIGWDGKPKPLNPGSQLVSN